MFKWHIYMAQWLNEPHIFQGLLRRTVPLRFHLWENLRYKMNRLLFQCLCLGQFDVFGSLILCDLRQPYFCISRDLPRRRMFRIKDLGWFRGQILLHRGHWGCSGSRLGGDEVLVCFRTKPLLRQIAGRLDHSERRLTIHLLLVFGLFWRKFALFVWPRIVGYFDPGHLFPHSSLFLRKLSFSDASSVWRARCVRPSLKVKVLGERGVSNTVIIIPHRNYWLCQAGRTSARYITISLSPPIITVSEQYTFVLLGLRHVFACVFACLRCFAASY